MTCLSPVLPPSITRARVSRRPCGWFAPHHVRPPPDGAVVFWRYRLVLSFLLTVSFFLSFFLSLSFSSLLFSKSEGGFSCQSEVVNLLFWRWLMLPAVVNVFHLHNLFCKYLSLSHFLSLVYLYFSILCIYIYIYIFIHTVYMENAVSSDLDF